MSGEKQAAGKGAALLALRAVGVDARLRQQPDSTGSPMPAGASPLELVASCDLFGGINSALHPSTVVLTGCTGFVSAGISAMKAAFERQQKLYTRMTGHEI